MRLHVNLIGVRGLDAPAQVVPVSGRARHRRRQRRGAARGRQPQRGRGAEQRAAQRSPHRREGDGLGHGAA